MVKTRLMPSGAQEPMIERRDERIPFNRMTPVGNEVAYVQSAVETSQISGRSRFVERCETFLEQHLQVPRVLLTSSATSALELAVALAEIGPGDEVIMPSFTFVSTANAVVLRGGVPRFVDICPDTLNMDGALLEAAVTRRSRAVLPVHYAGVGCEMETILGVAAAHGLVVIEDAAQGLGASFRSQPLGTLGAVGAISFQETKNVGCGEGGALVINDGALIERAQILRDKGTNRNEFESGAADRYTWVDIGLSCAPSGLAAAFLLGQLECLERITRRRLEIWHAYRDALAPLEGAGKLRLPSILPDRQTNAHIFQILLRSEAERSSFISHMDAAGIHTVFHFVPLHTSPFGRKLGYSAGMLPITEDLASRLVRLPIYYELGKAELERVINAVHDFFEAR